EVTEVPGVRRHEGMPVRCRDEARPEQNEAEHDADLEHDDRGVERRGLPDADITDVRDSTDDEHRGQIKYGTGGDEANITRTAVYRCLNQRLGQVNPELGKQANDVRRPADRHGSDRKGVLEHEIPADEPGHELSERRV